MSARNYIASASLILLANGCAPERGLITGPFSKREPILLASPANIKGNEPRRVTENDSPYNLERVVINGHDLYVEKNTKKQEDERDFYFIEFMDHRKILNNRGKEIGITSDIIYIPTEVKTGDEIPKRITYAAEGRFGKKARITQYNLENIETGIIKETQKDTRYKLGTEFVAGNEWYVPRVEEEKMRESNALPFYMMYFPSSQKEIDANGAISIKNELGFYRPMAVSRQDYEKREIFSPTTPIPARPYSTGQAKSTTQ